MESGNVCCVAVVVKGSVCLALECLIMLYVFARNVMDVVCSVCIVTRLSLLTSSIA